MAKEKKNRGLGRGLSALMADVGADVPIAERSAETNIAIDLIIPNPDQPRRSFNKDALEELANSIREKGIIQPLILRPNPKDSNKYEIVAGERRWRAAQKAELHSVPAIVRSFNDQEVMEVAIIENIQRADLNSIDEAMGYHQLMNRFGHTQEHLAISLGKSRSHIANLLRLLTLPEEVKASVVDGKISAGHARALVGRDNAIQLAQEVISKGLSVRDTEKLVKPTKDTEKRNIKKKQKDKDVDTIQLENELSAHLSMAVSIEHDQNGESGRIVLKYRSLEQLDDLLRAFSEM